MGKTNLAFQRYRHMMHSAGRYAKQDEVSVVKYYLCLVHAGDSSARVPGRREDRMVDLPMKYDSSQRRAVLSTREQDPGRQNSLTYWDRIAVFRKNGERYPLALSFS